MSRKARRIYTAGVVGVVALGMLVGGVMIWQMHPGAATAGEGPPTPSGAAGAEEEALGPDAYSDIVRNEYHCEVWVPVWDDKCCKIMEYRQWNFASSAWRKKKLPWWKRALGSLYTKAEIYEGVRGFHKKQPPATFTEKIPSTCEEDKALLSELNRQKKAATPKYTAYGFNCWHWCEIMAHYTGKEGMATHWFRGMAAGPGGLRSLVWAAITD